MVKRRREDADDDCVAHLALKRIRTGPRHSLSNLSDEIIIRILSFLTVKDLLRVERTSLRFRALATDHEVWKGKFYDTWVKSRYRRLTPALRTENDKRSVKTLEWLQHSQRLRDGIPTDWKRQYKIRNNWHLGTARVREVEVAPSTVPPVIGRVYLDMVFTVDSASGLRCWQQEQGTRVLRAQVPIQQEHKPTCMAVQGVDSNIDILVGFSDGAFSLYSLRDKGEIFLEYSKVSEDGPLTAVALSMPFLMTTSTTNSLAVYSLAQVHNQKKFVLQTITRLQSDATFSPTSISLRRKGRDMVASIAYGFRSIGAGWCIGIQEITLTPKRASEKSTLPISRMIPGYFSMDEWEVSTRSTSSLPLPSHPQQRRSPQSLSYAHPFVMASLKDNTIMSFLVTSNDERLEISAGRRLWGHTAGISSAHVNNRGKAVSISQSGAEIRVWELEDVMTLVSNRRSSIEVRVADSAWSQVAATLSQRGNGLGLALDELKREHQLTRSRWVGFDEEQVIVLGERDSTQVMALYDFT